MAIEDFIPASSVPRTGHAPSRVRAMLKVVGNQLEVRMSAGIKFIFVGGKTGDASRMLAEVSEALDEWRTLDNLRVEVRKQQQRIAARMSVFVEFYSVVRRQIREVERKKRRPLTARERVVATAKLRETRRLRRTMGKRQRKAIRS